MKKMLLGVLMFMSFHANATVYDGKIKRLWGSYDKDLFYIEVVSEQLKASCQNQNQRYVVNITIPRGQSIQSLAMSAFMANKNVRLEGTNGNCFEGYEILNYMYVE